jgi:hypothetical protein
MPRVLTPQSWAACRDILVGRKSKKIANNTYLERDFITDDGNDVIFRVRLHRTRIVSFYRNGDVEVHTGGWLTVTTKERINRYLPPGYNVWSERGQWYTHTSRGRFEFETGMTIYANGDVSTAPAPTRDEIIAEHAAVMHRRKSPVRCMCRVCGPHYARLAREEARRSQERLPFTWEYDRETDGVRPAYLTPKPEPVVEMVPVPMRRIAL